MSLVDDKRTHQRSVVALKEKCKLILSEEIINKINYLHQEVTKNTEWSGILIYDTVEGNIEEAEDWVIKVLDVIPMDVGTGAYTEYTINGDDEYAAERWMEALADGKKMGHKMLVTVN